MKVCNSYTHTNDTIQKLQRRDVKKITSLFSEYHIYGNF